MSVAIVCMVNHTAVVMMRDADETTSSSSEGNLTIMTPGELQMNDSGDATKRLQSPCVGNLIADSNSSAAVVIAITL